VLVGTETADDAAVYRLGPDLALVQTLDYFTPIVDDPYGFGAIAAANALSDLYAMGATPLFALNIVGFPVNKLPMAVLKDILRGGADKAREAGIGILGGHSIDDAEPKYGLVCTGRIHPDRIWKNVGAKPGDELILTKPLGMGIISTAIKREKAAPALIQRAIEIMATLNRGAAEAVAAAGGADAVTDVTGFGLLGHLREMTAGSGVGARLRLQDVPILDGVWDLARAGLVPGGTERNLAHLQATQAVEWGPGLTDLEQKVLSDAQTSGGLLVAVPKARAAALLEGLRAARTPAAARIGEIVEDPRGRIRVER
jgi:selenide, water dikinase